MILYPQPKINLGLDILRRRTDGFHEIDTLMLPVGGVCDILTIEPAATKGLRLETDGLTIDCATDRNLVAKAWMLMNERYGIGGAYIKLDKRIPFGAGLGGGSADAAATLVGLNEVFFLGLTTAELESLAAELGSDVPFFITAKPMFCRGRGEILTPAKDLDLSDLWCVVTKPSFGISTAEAYAGVTPHEPVSPLEERLRLPQNEWQQNIVNDFEPSLFERHLALRNIKRELQRSGAFYASLSGSGSALYGLYDHCPTYSPVYTDEQVFSCKLEF